VGYAISAPWQAEQFANLSEAAASLQTPADRLALLGTHGPRHPARGRPRAQAREFERQQQVRENPPY